MSSIADTFKTLGPARLSIMGAIVVGLLVFFAFVTTRVSQPDMSILYGDLTSADSSSVAAKLEQSQIAYRISQDGAQVFVPKEEVGRARMLLAEAGLPNGGSMGYEIFDQSQGFGQTQFIQNINQVRALQGELARTISSMGPVQYAKVHLVLPQRQLFERQAAQATASVTLKLKPTQRLNNEQIFAIQNLVANSVPGLQADKVTILDSEANLLAGGSDTSVAGQSAKSEERRRAFEQRLDAAVEELVGRVVGINHVRAQVTADLNFDVISRSREIYDPEGQVVRSTQTTADTSSETNNMNAQAVSVEQNLPGLPPEGAQSGSGSSSNRTQEVTNFEINKTVENITSETGQVQRLSVAVLVDGTYATAEDGTKTYTPRSEGELAQIKALVQSAVGFNAERGDTVEIVNLPFNDVEETFADAAADTILGFDKQDIIGLVEMLTLSIMVVLVLLLVVRPMLTKILAAVPVPAAGGGNRYAPESGGMFLPGSPPVPALTGPDGTPMLADESAAMAGGRMMPMAGGGEETMIDMNQIEGRVKSSSIKKVSEIVSTHPNETVSVIRNWMTQD